MTSDAGELLLRELLHQRIFGLILGHEHVTADETPSWTSSWWSCAKADLDG